MKTGRVFLTALAGVTLLGGLVPILPAGAQEVHGKVVIKGPDGVQEFDVDPSLLPPPGEGNHAIIMRVGPDGQVFTFNYSPDSLGGLLGPDGLMLGGPGGMRTLGGGMDIIDPGRSYIHQLIKRDDVRSELFITSKQREALEATGTNSQQLSQQDLQSFSLDFKGKSKEEIQAQMAEQAKKLQERMKNLADERDKKLAAILTPKQMDRLKELDLQWRGPLALGVKPVGDLVKLTQEQAPQESDLLKQYRQEVSKQLGFGVRTATFGQKPGTGAPATGTAPPAPSTPAEMQARMETAKKEIEKARKSLGDKALNGLTPEQRAQWSSLTGRLFRFRTN